MLLQHVPECGRVGLEEGADLVELTGPGVLPLLLKCAPHLLLRLFRLADARD